MTLSHVITGHSGGAGIAPHGKKPSRRSFDDLCLLQKIEAALQSKPDEAPLIAKAGAVDAPAPKMASRNDENLAPTVIVPGPQIVRTQPPPVTDTGDVDPKSPSCRVNIERQLVAEKHVGETGYRYGTVPLLVSGQLVELDLVRVRVRPGIDSKTARRLVMTLDTASLGRVEVKAERSGSRLSVTFAGRQVDADEELAAYDEEVRGLLARLNWNIETVAETAENGK